MVFCNGSRNVPHCVREENLLTVLHITYLLNNYICANTHTHAQLVFYCKLFIILKVLCDVTRCCIMSKNQSDYHSVKNDKSKYVITIVSLLNLKLPNVCRFYFAMLKLLLRSLTFHLNPALSVLGFRVASLTAVVSVMLWIWSHLCLISVFFR